MSGLAEQRLIIFGLEQTTAANRVRLAEACRTINPSADTVGKAMVTVGTALIAADLAPGIAAIAKAFSKSQPLGERRRRQTKVFLEAPRLLRTLRRLLP